GNTISDTGGVSWIVESVPKDWQASTVMVVGQRWLVPGDTRFVFEVISVTGDAKTGASLPLFTNQPQLEGTYTDNHTTVKVLCPANLLALAPAPKIRDFTMRGGMGFGVHFDSGYLDLALTRYTSTDFGICEHGHIFYAGGGFHNHGPDSNGQETNGIIYYGMS